MRNSNPASPESGGAGNQGPAQLSLVIATRGRAGFLQRCLDSLACQEAVPGAFEVIVVDNAAAPDPEVARLCRPETYPTLAMRCIHHPQPGSSGARNRGAAQAQGSLVAFLDDDVILPPIWMRQAFITAERSGARIFGGPYYPVYSKAKPPWYRDAYASGEHGSRAGWLQERQYLFAANLVFDKDLFFELGGFSLDLGPGTRSFFGEETDLQHRAARQGVSIWYDPDLWVHHHVAPAKMSPRYALRSSWDKGRIKARIFQNDFSSAGASLWRLRVTWLRQAVQRLGEIIRTALLLPFRSRKRYPYYQCYIVERLCPPVSGFAMLLALIQNGPAKPPASKTRG